MNVLLYWLVNKRKYKTKQFLLTNFYPVLPLSEVKNPFKLFV